MARTLDASTGSRFRFARATAWAAVLVAALGAQARAAAPRATIDVAPTVECRDVTAPDFLATHPSERVVEARFRVSVQLEAGSETDLEQLRVAIASPRRTARVVDYSPRSELASDLAGDVEVSRTDERSESLNATLGAVVGGQYGPAHVQASPGGGVGVSRNRGSKETFHRLPPKQLVLASGTTHAEHGVFFKWRRTSQVAIEGEREVTLRLLVPRGWRGDWVACECELLGRKRNYLGEKLEPCGQAAIRIGLYLAGDEPAKRAALELAEAQFAAPAARASAAGGDSRRHVSHKPVTPSYGAPHAEPAATAWLGLPALLKFCNHGGAPTTVEPHPERDRDAIAAAFRRTVPEAVEALETLSGQ